MEFLSRIRNYFTEWSLSGKREKAVEEAKDAIHPTCRLNEEGELINEIVVNGMPLFQVSNNDGRWNVKAVDVGDVIMHLRNIYVENIMNK